MITELFSFGSHQALQIELGIAVMLTNPYKSFEKFGITLPTEKMEKTYFYKNGFQSSVVSTTNTTYNQEDYPINVVQSLSGDTYISGYKYAKEKGYQRLIDSNMLGIPLETESKKNNLLLSKVETKYDNVNNLFPSSIVSLDLLNSIPYTEVTYDKYDTFGNLQQYTTKDGIAVAIVWGYNSTRPIAKVEGMTYDQLIAAASPTAIITASDNDAADPSKEVLLLEALNSFRKNTQLADRKVTTYTYDPLIGVTSITPPSGIRQVFTYDPANRLKETKVRSKDTTGAYSDKKAAEYKYNYKP